MDRDHRIRELLEYDAATGALRWLKSRSGISAGPAGGMSSNGYAYVSVDGVKELVHRVAWFLARGEWPAEDVDHINGDRTDNRLSNLRAVDRRTNNENRRKARIDNRSSGVTGVTRMRGRWRARIVVHGVTHYLGVHDTIEAASAAYINAKRQLHTGCTI